MAVKVKSKEGNRITINGVLERNHVIRSHEFKYMSK